MKITFADKSYIECRKENGKITIMISAKDHHNPLKKTTNTVELTEEEFKQLVSSLG